MSSPITPEIISLDDSFEHQLAEDTKNLPTGNQIFSIPHPPPLPPHDFLNPPRRSNRLLNIKPPVYVIKKEPKTKRKRIMPVDRSPQKETPKQTMNDNFSSHGASHSNTNANENENISLPFKNFPLILPEKFTGSNITIEKFLESVEAAIKVNKWNKDYLPLFIQKYLSGAALHYLEFLKTEYPVLDYNTFKVKFKEQFADTSKVSRLNLQLQNLKLESDDLLREYSYKVRTLCKKIDSNMSEEQIIFHLIKGLPLTTKTIFSLYPHSTLAEFDNSIDLYLQRQLHLNLDIPKVSQPVVKEVQTSQLTEILNKISGFEEKLENLKDNSKQNFKKSKKSKNNHSHQAANQPHFSNGEITNYNFRPRFPHQNSNRGRGNYYPNPRYYNNYNQFRPQHFNDQGFRPRYNNPRFQYSYNRYPIQTQHPPAPQGQIGSNQGNQNPPTCSICASNHPTESCKVRYCISCKKIGHVATSCYRNNGDQNFQ